MTEVMVGDMVVSLCGHDAGEYFIVTECEKNFVVICDGKNRKNSKRKKKNIKHVEPVGLRIENVNNVPSYAADANIRRELKRLKKLI